LIYTDIYNKNMVNIKKDISLEIHDIYEASTFVLRFGGISLIAPLDERILPPNKEDLPEPMYMIFSTIA